MRLLDELKQAEVMFEADVLQRTYLAFSAVIHLGWLGLETDFEGLQGYRTGVQQIWNKTIRNTD